MLTLTIGSTCMVLGYILRIPFRSSPDSVGLYAITTLFVLLSVSAAMSLSQRAQLSRKSFHSTSHALSWPWSVSRPDVSPAMRAELTATHLAFPQICCSAG